MASPITSVTPVDKYGTPTGPAVTNLPVPTKYEYGLADISAPEAGRTEDMAMNKMRQGQARHIDLEWTLPTIAECAAIMAAYNSEYILVNFLDGLTGTYMDKRFYVGDRSSPLWNSTKGRWESLSFGIIQQIPDVG